VGEELEDKWGGDLGETEGGGGGGKGGEMRTVSGKGQEHTRVRAGRGDGGGASGVIGAGSDKRG